MAIKPQTTHERELPMLAAIAGFFRWLEELLNILNGPILVVGLAIALMALLSDNALIVDVPILLYVWAGSQAIGIDTQLLACFARARTSLRQGHYWAIAGWIVLGLILGYAAWQAGYVFAVEQSQHISEQAALAQLNMSPEVWLGWRAFLAAALVALAGWTRYAAPTKNIAHSTEEEREKLEAEIALEPLREQLRLQRVRGARSVAAAAVGRMERHDAQPAPTAVNPPLPPVEYTPWALVAKPAPDDDRTPPPTNGGVPASTPVQNESPAETATAFVGTSYDQNTGEQRSNGRRPHGKTRSVAASRARVRVVGEGMDARRERQRNKAFGILDKDPNINPTALAKRIRSTWRTANRLKNDWQSLQHARQAVQ